MRLWRAAEAARCALNSLWDPGYCPLREVKPPPRRLQRGGLEEESAWRRLLQSCRYLEESRRPPVTGDALRMVLRTPIDAYEKPAVRTYIPFIAARQAEPPVGHTPVDLLRWLPPEICPSYATEERFIRPGAADDPTLKELNSRYDSIMGSYKEYIKYVRPEVPALWYIIPSSSCRASCCITSVPKRSGAEDRKILAICPQNWAAVNVTDVAGANFDYGLYGPAALAQVRAEYSGFHIAALDESNAFSYVSVPYWWACWQCGPELVARDLPRHLWIDRFKPLDRVRPAYGRLAMGGTHAVYLLWLLNHSAIREAAGRLRREASLALLNIQEVRRRGVRLQGSVVAVYSHVDDVATMAEDPVLADRFALAVKAAMERRGFHVKFQAAGTVTLYVGLSPTYSPPGFQPEPERLRLLNYALAEAQEAKVVAPRAVSSLIGHVNHYALLRRSTLTLTHACYAFIAQDRAGPLWPSVCAELESMRRLLGFMIADLSRTCAPVVGATDASGPGGEGSSTPTGAFCIAVGRPPEEEIVEIASRSELRHRSGIGPEHIDPAKYEAAKFDDESPVFIVDPVDGLRAVSAEGTTYRPTLCRSVLPSSWFAASAGWQLLLARRWARAEHITSGELRAGVVYLRAVVGAASRLDVAHVEWLVLTLGDNQVAISGLARGRSSRWNLNRLLRQRLALELASGICLLGAWCDTHHMPADGGTRPDSSGHLRLERPTWIRGQLVLIITRSDGPTPRRLEESCDRCLPLWIARSGGAGDLLVAKNRGRLFSMLSSGHVADCWWLLLDPVPAHATVKEARTNGDYADDNDERRRKEWAVLSQGVCIGYDRGSHEYVCAEANDRGWKTDEVQGALTYTSSISLTFRRPCGSTRGPWRPFRLSHTHLRGRNLPRFSDRDAADVGDYLAAASYYLHIGSGGD